MAEIFLLGADVGIGDDTTIAANIILYGKFTCGTSANLTQIRVKANDTGNVKVGIYSDDGGTVQDLLASNQDGTAVVSGWNTISITSTAIIATTVYWLAVVCDDLAVRFDAAAYAYAGESAYLATAYANALAASDPAVTYPNPSHNIAIAGWGLVGGVRRYYSPGIWR